MIDFCSGSSLLFTLFRQTGDYHCLYEPLHQRLPEYQLVGLPAYERHFHLTGYFREYRSFRGLRDLFDRAWATERLHLTSEDRHPELYRYLAYLIGSAFRQRPRVALQFNRAGFRLGWMRRHFPRARIVHIWRDRERQWESLVRRVRRARGRDDVGQHQVDFNGFDMARWCDDLEDSFPELAAERSESGYERFSKLWELSREHQRRHADISVKLSTLTDSFASVFRRVRDVAGGDFEVEPLERYVVPTGERRRTRSRSRRDWRRRVAMFIHRQKMRGARIWVRMTGGGSGL